MFCVYFKIVSYKSYILVIKQYKIFTKMNHKCEIFFYEYFWKYLGRAMLAKVKKNEKPLTQALISIIYKLLMINVEPTKFVKNKMPFRITLNIYYVSKGLFYFNSQILTSEKDENRVEMVTGP